MFLFRRIRFADVRRALVSGEVRPVHRGLAADPEFAQFHALASASLAGWTARTTSPASSPFSFTRAYP